MTGFNTERAFRKHAEEKAAGFVGETIALQG